MLICSTYYFRVFVGRERVSETSRGKYRKSQLWRAMGLPTENVRGKLPRNQEELLLTALSQLRFILTMARYTHVCTVHF